MFFTIENRDLFPRGKPLHALVSSVSDIYFKGIDVGRLLKFKDPSHFARTRTSLQVRHVMYENIHYAIHPKIRTMRIFSMEETIDLLKKYGESKKMPKVIQFANQLADDNTRMKVMIPEEEQFLLKMPVSTKFFSLPVRIIPKTENPDPTEGYLSNFYSNMKLKCLELYRELYKNQVTWILRAQFPDFDKLEFDEPPTTAHVYFGEKKVEYRLV